MSKDKPKTVIEQFSYDLTKVIVQNYPTIEVEIWKIMVSSIEKARENFISELVKVNPELVIEYYKR